MISCSSFTDYRTTRLSVTLSKPKIVQQIHELQKKAAASFSGKEEEKLSYSTRWFCSR